MVAIGVSLILALYLSYSVGTAAKYFVIFLGISWFVGLIRYDIDVSASIPEIVKIAEKTAPPIMVLREPEMPALDPTIDTHNYLDLARFYAEKHGVMPQLVQAVMLQETGGTLNNKLVSPKGAACVMQLMPGTAKRYGVSEEERFIPEKCIEAGVLYLKDLRKMFDNDDLVLAAYNAGEGNVKKHKGIPPFAETQGYVRRINAIIGGMHFHGGNCDSVNCLSVKDGAQAGGKSLPEIYNLAAKVQNNVEIIWFSCFNDKYPHKGRGHRDGRAFDLTLVYPFKKDQAIRKIAEICGQCKIIDEYDNPSSRATGGHLHVEIPSV